jgi:hypothetical protein
MRPAKEAKNRRVWGVLPHMMWWLMIGAMVAGAGLSVIGAACWSFARDVDREERAEGDLVAECNNPRAALSTGQRYRAMSEMVTLRVRWRG